MCNKQLLQICIAMLIACAFAVESAAIAENPGLVRQEEAPKLTNVEQPAQEPEEHTRQKKFAGMYFFVSFHIYLKKLLIHKNKKN